MKMYKGFFVVLTCLFLLFLSSAKDEALAACTNPVKIVGSAYNPISIQDAYDHASNTLGLSSFTLLLAGEIFTENLILDGGAVVLDGEYDCSFTTKNSTSGILGTLTISTGSLNFASGTGRVGVVSTSQCDFDTDLDGFTRIGSCAGSADDCNDNDPGLNPGAVEICDGLDNNCDGQVDEGLMGTDADGDGYFAIGSCGAVVDDCNDNNTSIHPGAIEISYDGIDQDCNGSDLTFANGDACADCHVPDAALDLVHSRSIAPNTSCAVCHAAPVSNFLAGHYGKTVRTMGNGMNAGSTIACGSCHDNSNHSGGFTLGNGSSTVWGKISPVYPNFSCDSCHQNRASLHATTAAHNNRIIDSSCATCHTSDTSVLGTPGSGTLANAGDIDTLHRSDCALCHNYTGTLLDAGRVRQAIQQGLNGTQITCTSCHTDKVAGHGSHFHTVGLGSGDLSNGTSCDSCHVVANWSEIEGIEHNVATNGAGSCATCHNSPRQEVIDAIALGSNPTHCLDCHANKTSAHSSVDHVSAGYVTLASTCADCHDPGGTVNATVIGTHLNNCALCHTTVPNLQPGIPANGGDCTTCHGANVQTLHPSCTSCHGEPPSGTTAPNREGAHADHAGLGFGSVNPNCGACHNGASHYSGTTDVNILSNFNAMSGSANSNGSTCSSTRCHGGQTTPAWSTGSINVNTDCTTCHTRRTSGDSFPDQYNDYSSGEHGKHQGEASCTDCHSITKLAVGHFNNLETSAFEQDPAATIGGSGTKVGSYNGSSCSNIQCHGSESW